MIADDQWRARHALVFGDDGAVPAIVQPHEPDVDVLAEPLPAGEGAGRHPAEPDRTGERDIAMAERDVVVLHTKRPVRGHFAVAGSLRRRSTDAKLAGGERGARCLGNGALLASPRAAAAGQ